jgi:catechol 2,3-dioxygenase-like lactoylglutathione lyase family enzyme
MTATEPSRWPNGTVVSQVCFTRPTRDLKALLGFYRDGLGLELLYGFDDARGPAGAMLGLPGRGHHFELLRTDDAVCAPPSKHHVLVLHLPAPADVERLAARLRARGLAPVAPANPWWNGKAVVFEDPDGWPVVLSHGAGLPA